MQQNTMNMDAIRQAELKAEAERKVEEARKEALKAERKAEEARKEALKADALAEEARKEALKADALAEEARYPRIDEGPESNIGKTVIDMLLGGSYKIYGIEAEYNLYILSPSGGLKLPFDYRKDWYEIV